MVWYFDDCINQLNFNSHAGWSRMLIWISYLELIQYLVILLKTKEIKVIHNLLLTEEQEIN